MIKLWDKDKRTTMEIFVFFIIRLEAQFENWLPSMTIDWKEDQPYIAPTWIEKYEKYKKFIV